MVIRQVHQVSSTEYGAEFSSHHFGISSPHRKAITVPALPRTASRTSRSSWPELVRQYQIQSILAQFGEHIGETSCTEGLELVQVQMEVTTLVFGHVSASQSRATETGDQKSPKSEAVSSPILPLARLTKRIFPSSITAQKSSGLSCAVKRRARSGFDRNAPILF